MQVPPRSPAGRCSGSGAEQTSLQEEGARKHPGKPGAEGTCQNGNKKPKHGRLRQQNLIPYSTPGLLGPWHGGSAFAFTFPVPGARPSHPTERHRGEATPQPQGSKTSWVLSVLRCALLLGVRAGQRDPPGSLQEPKHSPGAGAGGAPRDGSACSAHGSSTQGHHGPEFSAGTGHTSAGCAANPPPKHF